MSLLLTMVIAAEPVAPLSVGPKTELGTVTFQSTAPYMVVLPTGYDATKKYPLVVMMHGLGSTLKEFSYLLPMLNTTDYIYVFTQAPFPYLVDENNVGYAWSLWQDPALMMRMAEESLRYLGSVIDKVTTDYPIATEHIYAFGHSQGGLMCYLLLVNPPSIPLRGIVTSGGFIDDTLKPFLEKAKRIPVLALHGTKDEIIPYDDAVKLNQYLISLKYPAQIISYPIGHTLTQEILFDLDDFILRRWMADPQSGSTPFMIKALEGDDRSLQMITSGTRSGDPLTRIKAIRLLGFLTAPPAEIELEIRKGFERNASLEEMVALCRAAAAAKIPATTDQLVKLAKDKGRPAELREAALSAIRRMHLPEADAALGGIPTVWKVTWVDPDMQASKLGMMVDDIVLTAAGQKIGTQEDLRKILSEKEGKPVDLEILRGDNKVKMTATGGRLGVRLVETPG